MGKDNYASENFGPHEDEKFTLEEQNIEWDYRNLVGESLDTGSYVRDNLLGHTSQNGLLTSELLSSLRKIRLSKQEFPTGKPISDIKNHHSGSQNDNPFHLFNK